MDDQVLGIVDKTKIHWSNPKSNHAQIHRIKIHIESETKSQIFQLFALCWPQLWMDFSSVHHSWYLAIHAIELHCLKQNPTICTSTELKSTFMVHPENNGNDRLFLLKKEMPSVPKCGPDQAKECRKGLFLFGKTRKTLISALTFSISCNLKQNHRFSQLSAFHWPQLWMDFNPVHHPWYLALPAV